MPQSMLYRTHQPSSLFQFQFHTILPFSSSTNSTSSSLSSSKAIVQVESSEMECIEAALKPSFRKEIVMKPNTPQGVLDFDDTCTMFDVQNGVSCDDHFVDEFLDLSNEDGFVENQKEEEKEQEEKKFKPLCSEDVKRDDISCVTSKDDFGSLPNGEISLPADDLEDLEWLSHFVEDCFSGLSHTGMLPEKPNNIEEVENRSEPEMPGWENHFKTSVPAKARSKRSRTGGRVWSFRSPPLTETSSSSSSSNSCSPSSNWLICTNRSHNMEMAYLEAKPPVKRQKKKPAAPVSGSAPVPRRCSHCGVQKTPQWRAGPLGAKTLCNACGVRYKSGRLLPEYRPACSPTFSSELHSNHHRKVLEMRRKKEPHGQSESGWKKESVGRPESGLAVSTFG